MKLINTSTSTGATALNLTTSTSKPPMVVNSKTKVANLNADLVDGKDSTAFAAAAAAPLWANVIQSGFLSNSKGATSVAKGPPGFYEVFFNRPVGNCAYVATISRVNTPGEVYVSPGNSPESVIVETHNNVQFVGPSDKAFYLVVTC
jgi:hypothetical protein